MPCIALARVHRDNELGLAWWSGWHDCVHTTLSRDCSRTYARSFVQPGGSAPPIAVERMESATA